MNTTVQYLNALAEMTKGQLTLYSFVLKHGREFPVASVGAFPRTGKMKECYRNAYQYCMANRGSIYCEGFATSIIPVAHAWCLNAAGEVIDPTWEDGRDYFGVAFQTLFVAKTIVRRGYYGVIDDPEGHYPLLASPDPTPAFSSYNNLKQIQS